jgi:CBS domain-containing protein
MNAAHIMTRDVLTVTEDTSAVSAARLMLNRHASGVPVVNDKGILVGILTEGDLLRRVETGTDQPCTTWAGLIAPGREADAYSRAHGRSVGEIMTRGAVCVTADTSLSDVVRLMETHGIKRVPVLDGEKLVGIISRADLLRAFVKNASPAPAASLSDAQIQAQILSGIRKQPWAPRATISVNVRDGVVELAGVVSDGRARRALRVLCENFPGVNHVVDHLVWIEPMSGTVIEDARAQ